MDKEQRKQLYKLLEEWTRAEIIARHGPFPTLEWADYYRIAIDKENEIRELLYGSSDLVRLGLDWNILKEKTQKEKKNAPNFNLKKLSNT